MSKNWLWLYVGVCIATVISMVGIYIMPESPKFLYTKKRYEEARNAISWIAKINGRDQRFTKQFDQEIVDRNNGTDWRQSYVTNNTCKKFTFLT